MRRLYLFSLIGAGLVLFLVISALLARAFSVGGAEDAALTDLVTAEAHGNARVVMSEIDGCAANAACRARAVQVSAALKRPGAISIIQITQSAGFSLGSTLGTARVAWLVGGSLPRVQCVRVRHAGNVLDGFTVHLLRVSVRIPSSHDCPSHF